MNRKNLTIILIAGTILLVLGIIRFWTPEDNWICVSGEWVHPRAYLLGEGVKRGNPSVPKPTEPCPDARKPEADIIYEVYFSNNNLDSEITCVKVFPISKPISAENLNLQKVLEVLLQGVNNEDKKNGYFTNIPENVKIKSIKMNKESVKIDFSKDIEIGVGGSCRVSAIRAQIVKTVLAFDKNIRSVIISVEGNSESSLQP